jgi:predicted nucleotidyltransferase
LPAERVLFTARKFVSNGSATNITHVVYVDPDQYGELESLEDLRAVGRAVGKLNQLLPKRQFILIGPGRWGSRGDIRLGVNVTYADLSNAAVLVEVARQKGNYVPDLSFGTHFFQDLVEASIHYLPLYPDQPGNEWNAAFFQQSPNILADLVPEFRHLAPAVRVIDVAKASGGMVVEVRMNGDQERAMAFLAPPVLLADDTSAVEAEPARQPNHWRWRLQFAERLAASLDGERFGVQAIYIFGSTKNATAGPASDIDLLVHFRGSEEERRALHAWLEGWSLALDELNFLRTGYRSRGLLDVHLITDEDIARRTSFAAKIDAVTDAARPLPMGGARAQSK